MHHEHGGSMDIIQEKKQLREVMKERRSNLPLIEHRQKSMQIMHRLIGLPEWGRSRTIHLYVSCINNEVDTLGLFYKLFDSGVRVVVPRCGDTACQLIHQEISSLDELRLSRLNLMEPEVHTDRNVSPEQLSLVISPVLAFDRRGNRLGMGGGYYDSFLAKCSCPKIGLAFAFQEADSVPHELHDIPLDIIVTELETIRIDHG